MPPSKQPLSLQLIAMDVLVKAAVRSCEQRAAKNSSEEFRQSICALVKEDMCIRIPWHFLAEYSTKFVMESNSEEYRNWNATDAVDIMMDVEIVGLRLDCVEEFLGCRHLSRLRGVVSMNMSCLSYIFPEIIRIFHLNDLTILYFVDCTDHDLTIIGQSCPKLQYLDIEESDITDQGLRALSPCQELRFVGVNYCPNISHIGINHLLSVNSKLQALACGDRDESEFTDSCNGFDFLNYLDRPCLSMKGFYSQTHAVKNVDLANMVSKFPNLEYFEVLCISIENFSILSSLCYLTGLRILFNSRCIRSDFLKAWQSLGEFLRSAGENIQKLHVIASSVAFNPGLTSLDFIFRYCHNIVDLQVDYRCNELDIPPFPKLKILRLYGYRRNPTRNRAILDLKYSEMLNLEELLLYGFRISFETVKTMMFDHTKLPKLAKLKSFGLTEHEVEEIRRLARDNNLDFEIDMSFSQS